VGWLGFGAEVEDASNGVTNITEGVRHLFTGEIPPKIVLELDKMDKEHITARWKADAMIPWYMSSRSIVLLALTVNWLYMIWSGNIIEEYIWASTASLMIVVYGAFFGGKSLELLNGKKH